MARLRRESVKVLKGWVEGLNMLPKQAKLVHQVLGKSDKIYPKKVHDFDYCRRYQQIFYNDV